MASPDEHFKINLNQNLWGLVVGFAGVGIAEYYKLPSLLCFAKILSVVMLISVAFTTVVYTYNYCKNKLKE